MPHARAVEEENDRQCGDEAEPGEPGLEECEMTGAAGAFVFFVGTDQHVLVFSVAMFMHMWLVMAL